MEVVIASKNSLLRSIVMLRKEVGGARTQLYNSSPFGLHLIHLIHLRCKGSETCGGAHSPVSLHLWCTCIKDATPLHLCTCIKDATPLHLCTCIKDATPLHVHQRCNTFAPKVHRASCIVHQVMLRKEVVWGVLHV